MFNELMVRWTYAAAVAAPDGEGLAFDETGIAHDNDSRNYNR